MHRKSKEGSFRELFGFTQQELAKFIGVSRPMIAMQESRKRLITGSKSSILTELGTLYTPVKNKLKSKSTHIEKWPITQNTRKILQDQLSELEFQHQSASRKFIDMSNECKRLTSSLLAIEEMHPPEKFDDATKLRFIEWKNNLIDSRKNALLRYPCELQVNLQLKLKNLEQNIAEIKTILSEFDSTPDQYISI